MTEAVLEQRLEMLRTNFRQMEANINQLLGAIQDTEFWLAKVRAAEELPKELAEAVFGE